MIGAVYGGFVELDDSIGDDASDREQLATSPGRRKLKKGSAARLLALPGRRAEPGATRRVSRAWAGHAEMLVGSVMRDIRLFILGHFMLVAVAIIGSI